MRKEDKHCDTCLYACRDRDDPRQKCSSWAYNASTYTHDMLMEDWGRGYCRFWTPNIKKEYRDEK